MDPSEKAKKVCKNYDQEKNSNHRVLFSSQWQEIADYMVPNRDGFTTQAVVPGRKRMTKIYDSTAIWAVEQLAAGLHGLLTNPAIAWFQLQTKNRKLMQQHDVLVWIEEVEREIFAVLNSHEANFNSQAHEAYIDLAGFGTTIFLLEETPGIGRGVRFDTLALSECMIKENAQGKVDTVYRRFKWPVRRAYQEWGEKIGEKLMKAYTKDPSKEFHFIHEVIPRKDRDPALDDKLNKAYASSYVCEDVKHLISESGFDRFPFLVPRWQKMSGETYGRSPGMTALPDVKMLNEMVKTTLKAAQKVVDPPLLVPDDGFFLPVRTSPSSINFFRTGLGKENMMQPLGTGANIPLGLEMEEQRRQQILRIFYQDRLKLQKEKIEMTRAEALIRDNENLRMMSPTVGRLETEFLGPLIEGIFFIRREQGAIPDPPASLAGAELELKYTSPIARAQQQQEAQALQEAMVLLGPMAQGEPAILDNFDGDAIARQTNEWYGVPARIMKSKSKVNQIRQLRAQQQQEAEQAVNMQVAADASQKFAKAASA